MYAIIIGVIFLLWICYEVDRGRKIQGRSGIPILGYIFDSISVNVHEEVVELEESKRKKKKKDKKKEPDSTTSSSASKDATSPNKKKKKDKEHHHKKDHHKSKKSSLSDKKEKTGSDREEKKGRSPQPVQSGSKSIKSTSSISEE